MRKKKEISMVLWKKKKRKVNFFKPIYLGQKTLNQPQSHDSDVIKLDKIV